VNWADRCVLTAGLAGPEGTRTPVADRPRPSLRERLVRVSHAPLIRLCLAALLAASVCALAVAIVQAGEPGANEDTTAHLQPAHTVTLPG
jgi:hypothetical protein